MSDRKAVIKHEGNIIKRTGELRTAFPSVNIYENDDAILLHADMPGVKKEDIYINIDNGTLSLSGIRRFGNKGDSTWEEFSDIEYVRSFSIPQSINVEGVDAEFKNGVLKLHLPRSEASKPKMIEIKAA